jgi:hypothetical protein
MAIDRLSGQDANTSFFDGGLRHQVGVRQFTTQEVNKILEVFELADRDFVRELRRQLNNLSGLSVKSRDKRLKVMLDELNRSRNRLMEEFGKTFTEDLQQLAVIEASFEKRLIESTLPFTVSLKSVSKPLLSAVVTEQPFSSGTNTSRMLSEWLTGLSATDKRNLREAIQLGMIQGDSISNIVTRVAGTRAAGFKDGILGINRRNAEILVRTGVNHVSNAARELFWSANNSLVTVLRWTATLDGRTTAICQSRDGKFTATDGNTLPPNLPALDPPGARPPAHILCRSVMMAAYDMGGVVDLLGERPFVRSAVTGRKRQINFRDLAKQEVGTASAWKQLSVSERNARILGVKQQWAQDNIGRVPATLTYDQWLRRQPEGFQNEVLGTTKAEKFRGGATVDQFIDRRGNTLTLQQLEQRGI